MSESKYCACAFCCKTDSEEEDKPRFAVVGISSAARVCALGGKNQMRASLRFPHAALSYFSTLAARTAIHF
jgi:hypothetical protein